MKYILLTILLGSIVFVTGCATPLSSYQKSELAVYRAKGLEVKEKDPTTGAILGILPGGGSFYARHYGLGILNLLFWPASVLWDPISGYEGSQAINYYATKEMANQKIKREERMLDDALEDGSISRDEYIKKKREVSAEYSSDY